MWWKNVAYFHSDGISFRTVRIFQAIFNIKSAVIFWIYNRTNSKNKNLETFPRKVVGDLLYFRENAVM